MFCRDLEKVICSENVFFERKKVENFLLVVVCTAANVCANRRWKKVAEIRKALT